MKDKLWKTKYCLGIEGDLLKAFPTFVLFLWFTCSLPLPCDLVPDQCGAFRMVPFFVPSIGLVMDVGSTSGQCNVWKWIYWHVCMWKRIPWFFLEQKRNMASSRVVISGFEMWYLALCSAWQLWEKPGRDEASRPSMKELKDRRNLGPQGLCETAEYNNLLTLISNFLK